MNQSEALAFAAEVTGAIAAGDEERARALFNEGYPALRNEFAHSKPLGWMSSFFFELDEFLNDPEARRLASLTPGLILSSYKELLQDAEESVDLGT